MKKSDIQDFIQKQEVISHRNYMNYQESGTSRYYRAHERAEMLIDIARQALSAADDHQMCGAMRAELGTFGKRAMDILHEQRQGEQCTEDLLKDIKSSAITYGLISDPWR